MITEKNSEGAFLLVVIQYLMAGLILGFILRKWRRAVLIALLGLIVAMLTGFAWVGGASSGGPLAPIFQALIALYVALIYVSFLGGLVLGVVAREIYESFRKFARAVKSEREGKGSGQAT